MSQITRVLVLSHIRLCSALTDEGPNGRGIPVSQRSKSARSRRTKSKSAALGAMALLCGSMLSSPAAHADTVDVSPPGANDWSCKPTTEHPFPVILVPGTFENMAKNWATMAPVLKSQGYCVYALNYGSTNGAKKVDLVGHSQGGMMPRYYMGFLNGAKNVNQLVGIAPSNHGTQGLITPTPGSVPPATSAGGSNCQACADQQTGSPFLTKLNSIGDTVAGPAYTVISTTR